jgi:anti-sigma factor ChrR (cupin superfamily)
MSVLTSREIDGAGFSTFRPGVDALVLYGTPGSGPAAALLRYRPGAKVPAHRHMGHELVYVISGSQSDERGTHRAGTFVVNPPGSEHEVESADGCLVLIVWESPIVFR